MEEIQKVNLVTAYLNDVADSWFQGCSSRRTVLVWEEFVTDFCVCFEERTMTDIVEEFNKLRQVSSVEEYQTRFEELKYLLMISHPTLDEQYFMLSFISRLSDEL